MSLLACGRPKPPLPLAPTDEKLEDYHQKLRAYLSLKKLKYTAQRWQIAKSILKTAGHVDSGQIVNQVKALHPSIGAATVYRSIKVLVQAGLLSESHQTADGRILFERPDEYHHDHIICVNCNEVFEFHNEEIEKLQNEVSTQILFKPVEHKHVIRAECQYLKNKT